MTDQLIRLAAACLHRGEEPPLGGGRPVGNLFFAGCNLRCGFCQNHQISHHPEVGVPITPQQCAQRMLELAAAGAGAIGLVTPTHQGAAVARALELARLQGLDLPVIYNSNGTDGPTVLARFDGLVDLYLPDFKYGSDAIAQDLSRVSGYIARARRAVTIMHAQVGHLPDDQAEGEARRGLIVRHLVLPGGLAGTARVARELVGAVGDGLWLSLMAQYHPDALAQTEAGRALAHLHPELMRPIMTAEYEQALQDVEDAGLYRLFTQDPGSAPAEGRPDFDLPEPFRWS